MADGREGVEGAWACRYDDAGGAAGRHEAHAEGVGGEGAVVILSPGARRSAARLAGPREVNPLCTLPVEVVEVEVVAAGVEDGPSAGAIGDLGRLIGGLAAGREHPRGGVDRERTRPDRPCRAAHRRVIGRRTPRLRRRWDLMVLTVKEGHELPATGEDGGDPRVAVMRRLRVAAGRDAVGRDGREDGARGRTVVVRRRAGQSVPAVDV